MFHQIVLFILILKTISGFRIQCYESGVQCPSFCIRKDTYGDIVWGSVRENWSIPLNYWSGVTVCSPDNNACFVMDMQPFRTIIETHHTYDVQVQMSNQWFKGTCQETDVSGGGVDCCVNNMVPA